MDRVVITIARQYGSGGKEIGKIQDCLAQTAADYAKESGAVCVLKDACTVVADAFGDMYLNISGNAGMATAGSGDVLSGVLAGIQCMYLAAEKKFSPVMLAALGVYVHGWQVIWLLKQ